jgi:hypothetical protein
MDMHLAHLFPALLSLIGFQYMGMASSRHLALCSPILAILYIAVATSPMSLVMSSFVDVHGRQQKDLKFFLNHISTLVLSFIVDILWMTPTILMLGIINRRNRLVLNLRSICILKVLIFVFGSSLFVLLCRYVSLAKYYCRAMCRGTYILLRRGILVVTLLLRKVLFLSIRALLTFWGLLLDGVCLFVISQFKLFWLLRSYFQLRRPLWFKYKHVS